MFVIDIDWMHIIIWAFVFAFLILLKYVVTYFFLLRDPSPMVLGESRSRNDSRRPTIVWGNWDITARTRYLNQIVPPPDFHAAMQNSSPISYIEIEEPPPTYDECIKKIPVEKLPQNLSTQQPSTETEEKPKSPNIFIV